MRTHEQQYRVSFWEWQPSDGHGAWTEHRLIIPTLRVQNKPSCTAEHPTGSKRIVGSRRVLAHSACHARWICLT